MNSFYTAVLVVCILGVAAVFSVLIVLRELGIFNSDKRGSNE